MVTVKASVTLMTQFHFCYTWIVDCHANTEQNDVDQIEIEKNFGKGSKITYITPKPYFFQVGT